MLWLIADKFTWRLWETSTADLCCFSCCCILLWVSHSTAVPLLLLVLAINLLVLPYHTLLYCWSLVLTLAECYQGWFIIRCFLTHSMATWFLRKVLTTYSRNTYCCCCCCWCHTMVLKATTICFCPRDPTYACWWPFAVSQGNFLLYLRHFFEGNTHYF